LRTNQFAFKVTTHNAATREGEINMSGKGGKARKFPGIKGVRPDRKALRREEAIERNAVTRPENRRAARRVSK
jgi:hypothetical protein